MEDETAAGRQDGRQLLLSCGSRLKAATSHRHDLTKKHAMIATQAQCQVEAGSAATEILHSWRLLTHAAVRLVGILCGEHCYAVRQALLTTSPAAGPLRVLDQAAAISSPF
jgi:hypothetical protein